MSVMGPENGRQREKESPLRLYEGKKRFNETQHLRVLSFCWWSSESLLLTCSGPAMAVQSSVLSHCLLTGSSLSLFAFSSAPRSSIFRCCNRMPETRSLMRKVVYFDSLSYKLRCPCTGFLQGPPAVSAHGGKPRGKRMCEENHNTGAAGLYNNRRAPHPLLESARLPSWQQGLLSIHLIHLPIHLFVIEFQHELRLNKPHSNPNNSCSLASRFSPRNWMAQKMFWPLINTSQKLQKPEKSHFEKSGY